MSKLEDKAEYERRKQRRLQALGTNKPRCGSCGEDRWQTLELHHLAGQAHDDQVVIQCRNCHRVLSDAQRDHPAPQESAEPYVEMIGRFLLGLADMLRFIAERLQEFGRHLIELALSPQAIERGAQ